MARTEWMNPRQRELERRLSNMQGFTKNKRDDQTKASSMNHRVKVDNIGFLAESLEDSGFTPPPLKDIKKFLNQHPLKPFSAERMIDGMFFYDEIMRQADDFISSMIHRSIDEKRKIEAVSSADGLISIMMARPDPVNQRLIREKAMMFRGEIIPKILQALLTNTDDCFVERSVEIIHDIWKKECCDLEVEVIKVLRNTRFDYTMSLLCVLLSNLGSGKTLSLIWTCFHFLKNAKSHHAEGPLVALYIFADRNDISEDY